MREAMEDEGEEGTWGIATGWVAVLLSKSNAVRKSRRVDCAVNLQGCFGCARSR